MNPGTPTSLVFVGGCPRSGTTLVQRLLNSHPAIVGRAEFDYLPEIIQLHSRIRGAAGDRLIQYGAPGRFDHLFGDLVFQLLSGDHLPHGTRYISEKTPDNIVVFKDLARLFPEARFVAVARDPRAIFASWLAVARRAGKGQTHLGATKSEMATSVARYLNTTSRALEQVASRGHLVRYENLVTDPEQEMKHLATFLEVDYNPLMLVPSIHMPDKLIDGVWYTESMYAPDLKRARREAWRTTLSSSDVALVECACAEPAQSLGYSVHAPSGVRRLGSRLRLASYHRRGLVGARLERLLLSAGTHIEGLP